MSLSDCRHCWDTPCTCGFEEVGYRAKDLLEILTKVKRIYEIRLQHPRASAETVWVLYKDTTTVPKKETST